jgi:hypothetical protein
MLANLTFRGPCNVIYFYNKVNEMHNFSDLFDKLLDMFRTGPLSETRRVLFQINLRNCASRWLYYKNSYIWLSRKLKTFVCESITENPKFIRSSRNEKRHEYHILVHKVEYKYY